MYKYSSHLGLIAGTILGGLIGLKPSNNVYTDRVEKYKLPVSMLLGGLLGAGVDSIFKDKIKKEDIVNTAIDLRKVKDKEDFA